MQTAASTLPSHAIAPLRFDSILAVVEFDRADARALSAASRSALRHAAAMVAPGGGRLTVLHVLPIEPRTYVFHDGAPREPAVGAAARERGRLEHAVAAERIGVPYEVRIAHGLPVEAIDAAASDARADVVTIGYQDRPGAYADGFSVRALLHRVSCPVLVTRPTDAVRAGWEP